MTMNLLPLAAIASLGTCAAFPPGDLTSPQYWGNVFLDKYAEDRAEALRLEDVPPPRLETPRTVLLITGVTIPAESFDPIKARLERDGFRTVVYEPPDLLSGGLFENSERLAAVIEDVVARSGESRIDILAECTGGLLARHYIQALGGDTRVNRLVTFISPQHGVGKAPLAAAIAGWPALYDLSPGSDFLETVNRMALPPHVDVTSVYSCTDEYIQPYETSYVPGATNIAVGCDGTKIGHFEFFYDAALYRVMHAALVRPLSNPVPQASDPTPTPAPPTTMPEAVEPNVSEETNRGCSVAPGASADGAVFLLAAFALVALRRRSAR
jgi:triacylglycerol lipase